MPPYGSTITVLGSPLTFGKQSPTLLPKCSGEAEQPSDNTKTYCAHRHWGEADGIQRARAQRRTLGGETWPVHDTLLKQANHMQMDHLRQMLHINKNRGKTGPTGINEASDKPGCSCTNIVQPGGAASYWNASGPSGDTLSEGGRSSGYGRLERLGMVAETAKHGKQGGEAQTQIQQQLGCGKSA